MYVVTFMQISIIIPTYNEAHYIATLVNYLYINSNVHLKEIIVANYGNDDNTTNSLKDTKVTVLQCKQKGRACQMNEGATIATGEILYFIHADSLPPKSYCTEIIESVNKGYTCGRYKTKFATNSAGLRFNAFFTNFDLLVCYGGDQSFFITKKLFNSIGGFDEAYKIMEDYNITIRAKQKGKYCIMKNTCTISTRKYDNTSWWRVMMANKKMISMYKANAEQQLMVDTYKKMLAKK